MVERRSVMPNRERDNKCTVLHISTTEAIFTVILTPQTNYSVASL